MIIHSKIFNEKQYENIINIINDDKNNNITCIVDLIKKYFGINDFLIKIKNDNMLLQKFIIKCDINYDLFNIIKNNIIKICIGNYKCKYCIEYKLILILHLLNDFTNWKTLIKCIFYEPLLHVKSHYKNIYRQYRQWCLKGIFKKAFHSIIPFDQSNLLNNINNKSDPLNNIDDESDSSNNTNNNSDPLNNTDNESDSFNNTNNNLYSLNNTDNKSDSIKVTNNEIDDFYNVDIKTDFFIDATYIPNKNGFEDVVVNPELKKKNVTKLSTLSDVDGFILSVSLSKSKKKKIKYNKKEIKTANHDIELIQDLLNECNPSIKISDDKKYSLIGDKGYKTGKNYYIQKEEITIISPDKKNQKKKLINRHQKKKLGYRFIIENSINGFKHNSRISIRKDGKSNTFMGWVFISCLLYNIRVNKKKEKEYKDIF